jgi:hypothetical protein
MRPRTILIRRCRQVARGHLQWTSLLYFSRLHRPQVIDRLSNHACSRGKAYNHSNALIVGTSAFPPGKSK